MPCKIRMCNFIHRTFLKENMSLENILSEQCSGDRLKVWTVSGRNRMVHAVSDHVDIIKIIAFLIDADHYIRDKIP
jgi:hypothetical protein